MAAVLHLPEQKVILKGVSWETYERLLAEHEEESGTRFTYDGGILEILVPSAPARLGAGSTHQMMYPSPEWAGRPRGASPALAPA